MPFITLVIQTALEKLINKNYLKYSYKIHKNSLQGKVLQLKLIELNSNIFLLFGTSQIEVINFYEYFINCTVRANIITLLMFIVFPSYIKTQMINEGYINIDGNVEVILKLMDIINFVDITELLTPWLGDVISEKIISTLNHQLSIILHNLHLNKKFITSLITDEWKLMPSNIELKWFDEEVYEIKKITDNICMLIKQNMELDNSPC